MDFYEIDWSEDSDVFHSDTSNEIFDDTNADPEYKPKHIKIPDSKFKSWGPVTESSGFAGTSTKGTLKRTRSSRSSSSRGSTQSSKTVKSASRAFKSVNCQVDEKDPDKILSEDIYEQDKCDDHSRHDIVPASSGFAGTSIKGTLKRTRSSRSSSSRGSTQFSKVQSLPAESSDLLLQSDVPPPPDNLAPPSDIPNMYTQTLRMPSQPVPMQRSMRAITRPNMSHMVSTRGRNVQRGLRGRPVSMNPSMGRGASMKRPASMPLTDSPIRKRTPTDRNYSNNLKKTAPIAECLSESLTKPISSAGHKVLPNSNTQDVVNLFSKRGLTISTVETIGNSSVTVPAGISLNSSVTIIPTSRHKVPNKVANQTTSYKVSNVPRKNVDFVDLTGSESKLWPCEVCSKTFSSVESLYEHVSTLHKSHNFSFKCNLCKLSFPKAEMLRQHKLLNHKQEINSSIPFAIPILDIAMSSTVAKLQAMGVTNYVSVAQLDSQGSQYGMPIMNISYPGCVDGLKYTNFFNLGSMRKL